LIVTVLGCIDLVAPLLVPNIGVTFVIGTACVIFNKKDR
jgi:hypothetical protein